MNVLKESYEQGWAAYEDGRFDDAARLFEQVLSGAPGDARVLAMLAVTLLHRDGPKGARSHLDAAIAALGETALESEIALELCAQLMQVAEASGDAAGVYGRIAPHARAAAAAARTPAAGAGLYDIAVTLAAIANDLELIRAFFNSYMPGAVGLDLPMVASPVMSLRDWTLPKKRWLELDPPETVRLECGEYARVYQSVGHAAGVIPMGEILCGWDFVVTPRGEVIHDINYLNDPKMYTGGWFPHAFDESHGRFFHPWPERSAFHDADVLYLSAPAFLSIGHWQCDFLRRLRVLRHFPAAKIAVPADLPPKHREMLALFGVKQEDIIECALGARYRFRNLIVSKCGSSMGCSPKDLRFLGAALCAPPAPGPRTRVFLTRAASTRKIVNQDEVTERLTALGFDFFNLATASIAAQRHCLAQADIVIASMGSDLLASMFLQAGAHIIALDYNQPEVDLVTGALDCAATGIHAAARNVNFHLLACAAAEQRGVAFQRKDSDFVVDCDALERMIRGIPPGA
ncbi:MAG: glycosyltransferase 61 family protein [Rhodospirillaceae bacterium]|nr:glycosyltransferase 61 family protein [Rhodospirillaceae bacterium]